MQPTWYIYYFVRMCVSREGGGVTRNGGGLVPFDSFQLLTSLKKISAAPFVPSPLSGTYSSQRKGSS